MKNENLSKHYRFYIYRHIPGTDVMEYREATGNWVFDFEKAKLWDDEDFVVKKAKNLKHCSGPSNKHNYCIGRVEVSVDPYFSGILI